MIPFLKKKQEASISGPVDEVKMRKPDEDSQMDFDLIDAIAEDIMEALHTNNVSTLKEALIAFAEHIKEQDEIQDQSL